MKKSWEEYFDAHAPDYMKNSFTDHTVEEIDFIEKELKPQKDWHILDMGCGTGRHSVELARRGYQVTGIDLSEGMLGEAKKTAQEAEVSVNWIHGDATQYQSEKEFDLGLCICEGGFGLLGLEGDPIQHPLSILYNLNKALKSGARLMMTVINGFSTIRKYTQSDVETGNFGTLTMAENYEMDVEDEQGKRSILVRERSFIPTELILMFNIAGFEVEHIWGGTAGAWERRQIELDEIEFMIIGKKR